MLFFSSSGLSYLLSPIATNINAKYNPNIITSVMIRGFGSYIGIEKSIIVAIKFETNKANVNIEDGEPKPLNIKGITPGISIVMSINMKVAKRTGLDKSTNAITRPNTIKKTIRSENNKNRMFLGFIFTS
jgi:hypothetical protein